MPPPQLKPRAKRCVGLTQSPLSIRLIMSSTKVMSSPPELPQPLPNPWGATRIALLFDCSCCP